MRLCADPEVQAVVAYGSHARREARADSDLDLAVIVREPQLSEAENWFAGSEYPMRWAAWGWEWIWWWLAAPTPHG